MGSIVNMELITSIFIFSCLANCLNAQGKMKNDNSQTMRVINEFGCYEAKREEGEKAGTHRTTAHVELLPGVRLRHSVPLVQYI